MNTKILMIILPFLFGILCKAQDDRSTGLIQLQKAELKDHNLERTLSYLIRKHPGAFESGEWYLMDYLKSSVGCQDYLRLDCIRDNDLPKLGRTLQFFITIKGINFALPKQFPQEELDLTSIMETPKLYLRSFRIKSDYQFLIFKYINPFGIAYYHVILEKFVNQDINVILDPFSML